MKTTKVILILVLAVTLAVTACGCIGPDDPDTPEIPDTPVPAVPTPTDTPVPTTSAPQSIADLLPRDDLPGTFELRAVIDENTPGSLNVTEEALSVVSGNLSIGEIHAAQGIYTFTDGLYDVYITIAECNDSVNAANAVENYKNQPAFEKPPSRTVSRFGSVEFNGHEATEVRMNPLDGGVRYGYVWSSGNYVYILEPGTDDRQASLQLAQMIGDGGAIISEA